METFALQDGDFVIAPNGYQLTTGVPKLIQDLSIALREPIGSDQDHPSWGSQLPGYIGSSFSPETIIALIQSECERVLANYMAIQQALLSLDQQASTTPRFSAGELVRSVDKIDVSANPNALDQWIVNISLTTLDGQSVNLSTTTGA